MYEYLKKAQTELRIAQMAITDNEALYAKLDDMISELEDLAEEELDKQVS